MEPEYVLVHPTVNCGGVYVRRGDRGPNPYDFQVSYQAPDGRIYGLPHTALILEVFQKRTGATPEAFMALVDHLLGIIQASVGITDFPPELVQYSPEHVEQLAARGLNNVPGYDLEVFLVAFELIQIQEETRVPNGRVPTELFNMIRDEEEDWGELADLTIFGYRRPDFERMSPSQRARLPENIRRRDRFLEDLLDIV